MRLTILSDGLNPAGLGALLAALDENIPYEGWTSSPRVGGVFPDLRVDEKLDVVDCALRNARRASGTLILDGAPRFEHAAQGSGLLVRRLDDPELVAGWLRHVLADGSGVFRLHVTGRLDRNRSRLAFQPVFHELGLRHLPAR